MSDAAQAAQAPDTTASSDVQPMSNQLAVEAIDRIINGYLCSDIKLDAAIDELVPLMSRYVEEQRFRALARSMFLSGAGASFAKSLREIIDGPTRTEREALDQQRRAEEQAKLEATIEAYKRETVGEILAIMGLRRGDQIVVQSSTGETRTIALDAFALPDAVSSASPAPILTSKE